MLDRNARVQEGIVGPGLTIRVWSDSRGYAAAREPGSRTGSVFQRDMR